MRDPREELRRRLESGEISDAEASQALAALDRERDRDGDLAAVRAAEEPGTMMDEDANRIVDSWGIDTEIETVMRQLGLEDARP